MPNQPERCCNKLVNARIQKKKLKTLRNRLKAVTKSVDNTSPRSFGLPHLKRNLKKAKMLEDQYKTIEHQNRTLLQRMSNIMENPSKTTDNHMKAYGRWSRSLNLQRRRENLDRITCDNGHLLTRLQKMEPYYKVDEWERDFQRSEKIMRHMMEFDYVGPAGGEPDAGAVPVAAGASMQQPPQARSPSKKKAASPNKGRGASPRRGAGTSPRRRGGGGAAASPKQRRLKKLPRKVRERVPVPVSDEVVEIFRFPSLAVRGLGVPDSAWDISLFDSRARGDGNGGGDDHDEDGQEGGGAADTEAAATTVLVLRGNKVTRTAVATLALDDDTLDRVVSQSSALQAVFDSVRGGMRAYRALGLVRGDTQLTTQLANLLLGRLRVTPELQFTLVFEDGEGDEGGGRSNDNSENDGGDDDDGGGGDDDAAGADAGDAVDVEVGADAEQEEGAGKQEEEAKAEEAAMEKEKENKEGEEAEEEAAAPPEPANADDADTDAGAGEPDASGKAPPNGGAEGGGDAERSGAEQAAGSDGTDAAAASP